MKFRQLLLLGILASTTVWAGEPMASADSVRALLESTKSHQLLDSMKAQVDASMQAGMKAGLGDTKLTAKQQAVMDGMRAKIVALFEQELAWNTFEPMIIDIYTRNFSQKEVDGMLAFYRSETGTVVVEKMPLVMQESMQKMQVRMAALSPKIRDISRDAVAQMKALEGDQDAAKSETK